MRLTRLGLIAGLLALVLLVLPISAMAQLAASEVYANKPFQLAWTHDGVNTTSYDYYRNGVKIASLPVASRVNGEIIFDGAGTAGLAVGTYTVRCDAVGDGGTTPSANFTITVKALPAAPTTPTLPRLIRL